METIGNINTLWTSESVSEGHPDKVADAISDAVLDEFLKLERYTRVAVETFLPNAELAVIGGEIGIPSNSSVKLDDINYVALVRNVLRRIGYTETAIGFNADYGTVNCSLKGQSVQISDGVLGKELGAGDQGVMFGYACNDTEELMPAPIMFAHKLVRQFTDIRRSKQIPGLRPDAKSQVTFSYINGHPERIVKLVLAAQHDPIWNNKQPELKDALRHHVVEKVIPERFLEGFDWDSQYIVNGTGLFEIGGPMGDAGLTGRKIIVDTYGGMAPHGGGAFSGKDATKVDRSANYYARYVAKNIVAAGLADCCLIRVAYAIGQAEPIGLDIDTFGTETFERKSILQAIANCFDFRPSNIIRELDLQRPIYRTFSAYGHFGRTEVKDATWEITDKTDALRSMVGL